MLPEHFLADSVDARSESEQSIPRAVEGYDNPMSSRITARDGPPFHGVGQSLHHGSLAGRAIRAVGRAGFVRLGVGRTKSLVARR